jgi:hypothetical protein
VISEDEITKPAWVTREMNLNSGYSFEYCTFITLKWLVYIVYSLVSIEERVCLIGALTGSLKSASYFLAITNLV